jgi:hypothetical protein
LLTTGLTLVVIPLMISTCLSSLFSTSRSKKLRPGWNNS